MKKIVLILLLIFLGFNVSCEAKMTSEKMYENITRTYNSGNYYKTLKLINKARQLNLIEQNKIEEVKKIENKSSENILLNSFNVTFDRYTNETTYSKKYATKIITKGAILEVLPIISKNKNGYRYSLISELKYYHSNDWTLVSFVDVYSSEKQQRFTPIILAQDCVNVTSSGYLTSYDFVERFGFEINKEEFIGILNQLSTYNSAIRILGKRKSYEFLIQDNAQFFKDYLNIIPYIETEKI